MKKILKSYFFLLNTHKCRRTYILHCCGSAIFNQPTLTCFLLCVRVWQNPNRLYTHGHMHFGKCQPPLSGQQRGRQPWSEVSWNFMSVYWFCCNSGWPCFWSLTQCFKLCVCVCEIREGRKEGRLVGRLETTNSFWFLFSSVIRQEKCSNWRKYIPCATSNPTCSYGVPHLKCTADHEKNLPELKSLI